MLSSPACPCFCPEIGPASVMVGNLVSGKRIAQASGRDLGQIEDNDQARKVSPGSQTSAGPLPCCPDATSQVPPTPSFPPRPRRPFCPPALAALPEMSVQFCKEHVFVGVPCGVGHVTGGGGAAPGLSGPRSLLGSPSGSSAPPPRALAPNPPTSPCLTAALPPSHPALLGSRGT